MTSAIDPSKPTTHIAYTADVRNNFQIAYNEITALQATSIGGQVMQIVTSTANIMVGATATYVAMRQSTPTAVQITLPPTPGAGRSVTIKDSLGVCSTTPFTVNTSDSSLIDGAATFVIRISYQSQLFVFDGVAWGVNG